MSTGIWGIKGEEVKGRKEIGEEAVKERMAGDLFQPSLQGVG